MQNLRFDRIANLDQLILDRPGRRGAIVLLHGYGADFTDLSNIPLVVDPSLDWDWYFPNAPHDVPYAGRAWFPIDMLALENAMGNGDPHPFANYEPQGLATASEMIQNLTSLLVQRYEVTCIGGFSQGAMVSCDASLCGQDKPAALLQLSGTFAANKRWTQAIESDRPAFSVLQSHGRHDPVLPFLGAEELVEFWKKHQIPHRFLAFQGGHEIPNDVLQAMRHFLKELVPAPQA